MSALVRFVKYWGIRASFRDKHGSDRIALDVEFEGREATFLITRMSGDPLVAFVRHAMRPVLQGEVGQWKLKSFLGDELFGLVEKHRFDIRDGRLGPPAPTKPVKAEMQARQLALHAVRAEKALELPILPARLVPDGLSASKLWLLPMGGRDEDDQMTILSVWCRMPARYGLGPMLVDPELTTVAVAADGRICLLTGMQLVATSRRARPYRKGETLGWRGVWRPNVDKLPAQIGPVAVRDVLAEIFVNAERRRQLQVEKERTLAAEEEMRRQRAAQADDAVDSLLWSLDLDND